MNKTRRKEIDKAIALLESASSALSDAHSILEQVSSEERETYDNMPDSLKEGDRGQATDNAATILEEVSEQLGSFDIEEIVGRLNEAQE